MLVSEQFLFWLYLQYWAGAAPWKFLYLEMTLLSLIRAQNSCGGGLIITDKPDKHTDKQMDKHMDKHTDKHNDKNTDKHTDTNTIKNGQKYGQTEESLLSSKGLIKQSYILINFRVLQSQAGLQGRARSLSRAGQARSSSPRAVSPSILSRW